MTNILNYTKEFVKEIYNRDPDWDYPIKVTPDKIIINYDGRYPRTYGIEMIDELFLITADYDSKSISVYSPCETIGQVVDFVFE